jgi:hypothetical protein
MHDGAYETPHKTPLSRRREEGVTEPLEWTGRGDRWDNSGRIRYPYSRRPSAAVRYHRVGTVSSSARRWRSFGIRSARKSGSSGS